MAVAPVKQDKVDPSIEEVARKLAERHGRFDKRVDVSMPEIGRLVSRLLALLFPHYVKDNDCGPACLTLRTEAVCNELAGLLTRLPEINQQGANT